MRHFSLLLTALLLACCSSDNGLKAETSQANSDMKMNITIGCVTQSVTLADNAAAQALAERLQQGAVEVTLNSSGDFEIWGALGFELPASDKRITAQPGDVILYNGSNICLLYGSNTWSYTLLGHIDGLTEAELRTFLHAGERNISVTLSLTDPSGIGKVKVHEEDSAKAYTLSGTVAQKGQKGIVVQNGKKIVR